MDDFESNPLFPLHDETLDKSLPLQDETLAEGLTSLFAHQDESSEHETEPFPSPQPPVAARVRFGSDGSLSPPSEDGPGCGDSPAATTAAAAATRVDPQMAAAALTGGNGLTDSTWQVDGSYDSIVSNRSLHQGTQGLTMRDYEEQLTSLRKENFNLKLRIYFMEENKGLLHGQSEQENLYRINIDLKVSGEELKKELAEKQTLLTEAASAIQALEQKYKAQILDLQHSLEEERFQRKETETRLEDLEVKIREDLENKKDNETGGVKGLSEESRILYNEAFGSFSLAQRVDQSDNGGSNSSQHKTQMAELASELTAKSRALDEKEAEIRMLESDLIKSNQENDEFSTKFSQCEQQLAEKNEQLANHEQQLAEISHQLAQLDQQLCEKESVIKREQVEKEEAVENANRLKKKIEYLEETVKANEAGKAEQSLLEQQVMEYEKQLQQLRGLGQRSVEMEQQIRDYELKISKLEARLVELEDQRSSHLSQIVELKRLVADLRNQLNDTESANQANKARVEACNETVSRLEEELSQRNIQVCSFLTQLKKLRPLVRSVSAVAKAERQADNHDNVHGMTINNDVIDLEEHEQSGLNSGDAFVKEGAVSVENLEEAIVESQAILAEIIHNSRTDFDPSSPVPSGLNASRLTPSHGSGHLSQSGSTKAPDSFGSIHQISSGASSSNTVSSPGVQQHLEYALERNAELETALCQSEAEIQESYAKIKVLEENLKVLTGERLHEEEKMEKLYKKFENFEENLKIADINLKKAHKCIQGFVKENQILSERLKLNESSRASDPEAGKSMSNFQRGVDKARSKFSVALQQYRGRYDKLRGHLKQRDTVCEMLRVRMEELAHFLGQLIENGDDTLNLSTVSIDLRESIQNSIEQSLLLSASIVQSNSLLEDERKEEEEVDGFNDSWAVPNVSLESESESVNQDKEFESTNYRRHTEGNLVNRQNPDGKLSLPASLNSRENPAAPGSPPSLFCQSNAESQEPSLGTEYETLLVDLRDALRKRREAEEALESKEVELGKLKEELELAELEIISLKTSPSADQAGPNKPNDASFQFSRPKTPPLPGLRSTSPVSRIPVRLTGHARSPSLPGRIAHRSGSPATAASCSQRQQLGGAHASLAAAAARKDERGLNGAGGRRASSLPRPHFLGGSDSISEPLGRRHVSRIPKPINRNEDEEDAFSEPDKEESRRRMGIVCKDNNQNRGRFRAGSEDEEVGRWERSRLETLQREKQMLGVDISLLEQEKAALVKKLAKMQSNLDTAELIIKEQQDQLKEKPTDSRRSFQSNVEINSLADKSSEEENQNRINELELRSKGQTEALTHLKAQLDKTEKRLSKETSKYQRKIDDLELKAAKEEARVQSLKDDLVALEVRATKLKQERDELREAKRELVGDKEQMGRTLVSLKEQVSHLEESRLMLQSLEKEFNQLSRDKKELELTSTSYLTRLTNMEEKARKLTSTNASLEARAKSDTDRYRLDMQRLKATAETLAAEKEELSSSVSSLGRKLELSEKAATRLGASRTLAETLCNEYREKCESLSAKLESTADQLGRSEQLVKHLHLQENQLKASLEKAKSAELETRTKYTELLSTTVSFRSLETKLEQCEKEKKTAETKLVKMVEERQKLVKEKEELGAKFKETEQILRTLTEEDGENNYAKLANMGLNLNGQDQAKRDNQSKHEIEVALKQSLSRPASRRTPLADLDPNTDRSLFMSGEKPKLALGKMTDPLARDRTKGIRFEDFPTNEALEIRSEKESSEKENGRGTLSLVDVSGGEANLKALERLCCSAQDELVMVKLERDAALAKLRTTRGALKDAAERINKNNRRKKKVEEAIVDQLTKTRSVLKKAQDNLEGCTD